MSAAEDHDEDTAPVHRLPGMRGPRVEAADDRAHWLEQSLVETFRAGFADVVTAQREMSTSVGKMSSDIRTELRVFAGMGALIVLALIAATVALGGGDFTADVQRDRVHLRAVGTADAADTDTSDRP